MTSLRSCCQPRSRRRCCSCCRLVAPGSRSPTVAQGPTVSPAGNSSGSTTPAFDPAPSRIPPGQSAITVESRSRFTMATSTRTTSGPSRPFPDPPKMTTCEQRGDSHTSRTERSSARPSNAFRCSSYSCPPRLARRVVLAQIPPLAAPPFATRTRGLGLRRLDASRGSATVHAFAKAEEARSGDPRLSTGLPSRAFMLKHNCGAARIPTALARA